MKKRNHAFDLLCGICIVRMICYHTMQVCGCANVDWWLEVMQWSYFFMSFFFFKAGYFNKSVTKLDSLSYCKDKAKRLLVPYFSAGIIGAAIYFAFLPHLLHKYHHPIEPLEWSHIWTTSQFYGNIPVWFLFSFFCAYVAIHFLERLRHWLFGKHFSPRATYWSSLFYTAFPAISYWLFLQDNPLWMSVNNVFMGIFYFELGRVWRRLISLWSNERTIFISIALIMVFIVGNIVWHDASYTMSSNTFTGSFIPLMINSTAILCGLSGLLIASELPRVPIISYIGEHSMVYFIGHYPILYYYKFMNISFGYTIYGKIGHVLILLPAIFMICSWLVPYIEGLPWLSGRWPKETSQGSGETVTK